MEFKTTNGAPQAAASSQKLAYKSPSLQVYGAVHQFTQGSMGTKGDGALNKTMV